MVDEDPTISDIVALLSNDRNVVVTATLQSLVPCTAGDAGLCQKLARNAAFLRIMLDFADKSAAVRNPSTISNDFHRAVLKLLVSITCDEAAARHVLRFDGENAFLTRGCKRLLSDVNTEIPANLTEQTDSECMLLSNLTREPDGAEAFMTVLDYLNAQKVAENEAHTKSRDAVDVLFENFVPTTTANNPALYKFPHFLYVLANLSQLASFRRRIRDFVNIMTFSRYSELLERYVPVGEDEENQVLLPFAQLIRNMSLDSDMHAFLLQKARIVPYLLFPLCDAEADDIGIDDEMSKLDLRLQFLPPTKRRAKSSTLKQCLLECLYQLSSTRNGRKVLNDAGTYLILREFHKRDTDARCVFTCENLVDVLIRDEEDFDAVPDIRAALSTKNETGAEPVDPEMEQKLTKMNEDLLQNAVELVSERAARQKASDDPTGTV